MDYERTPNVVAGLRTARERGWIDITDEDDQFTALNALVANVYSGGSIDDLPDDAPSRGFTYVDPVEGST